MRPHLSTTLLLLLSITASAQDERTAFLALKDRAEALFNAGHYQEAASGYEQALGYAERSGLSDDDMAQVWQDLANSYFYSDRGQQAEALYRRALAYRERVNGPDHVRVGNTLLPLAAVVFERDPKEAEALWKRALPIVERNKMHPANACLSAIMYTNLGDSYARVEDFGKAEAMYLRPLDLWRNGLLSCSRASYSFERLGWLYSITKRLPAADEAYAIAIQLWQHRHGEDHERLIPLLHSRGAVIYLQDRFHEAEPFFNRALELMRMHNKLGTTEHQATLSMLHVVYLKSGRKQLADAVRSQMDELDRFAAASEVADPRRKFDALTGTYQQHRFERQDIVAAERDLQKALELARTLPFEEGQLTLAMHHLAGLRLDQGRIQEAESTLRDIIVLNKQHHGEKSWQYARARRGLAGFYDGQDQFEMAAAEYQEVVALFEDLTTQNIQLASLYGDLGAFYQRRNELAIAQNFQLRALQMMERVLGPDSFGLTGYLEALAKNYLLQGKNMHAEPLLRRSLALSEKQHGTQSPYLNQPLLKLEEVLRALGRAPDAELLAARRKQLKP